jgi:small ubiquitin-related modifier
MADGNTYAADNDNGADNLNNAVRTPHPLSNDTMAVLKNVVREGYYPEIMEDAIEAAREDIRREHGMYEHAMPPPPPPPPPVKTRQVSLIFNGSGGESITFKLKETTKLRKAMDHYSAKFQRPVDQLRFLFEGHRLGDDDTPLAVSSPLLSHRALSLSLLRAPIAAA